GPRHAVRYARVGRIGALPAFVLILQVRFEDGLKLRRQRRTFLAPRLGRVPLVIDAGWAAPLATPVRIFRLIVRLRAGDRQSDRGSEDERADTVTRQHPFILPETLFFHHSLSPPVAGIHAAGRAIASNSSHGLRASISGRSRLERWLPRRGGNPL